MAKTAKKDDPKLWETVKKEVTKDDKGGKPGQWSARKAQLAVHEYKEEGGGYKGAKEKDNSLSKWTKEDWGTKSGKESGKTGERYLPKAARDGLSDEDYARTTRKKQADAGRGKQFSAQPKDVARKTAPARSGKGGGAKGDLSARTKAELMEMARDKNVPGRSRMDKAALMRALS